MYPRVSSYWRYPHRTLRAILKQFSVSMRTPEFITSLPLVLCFQVASALLLSLIDDSVPVKHGSPFNDRKTACWSVPWGTATERYWPELAPDARYWMLSNAEDGLKFWVIGMVSFIVFSLTFEVQTYAILRANELKYPWYAIQTTLQANHMSLANTSTTGTVTQRSITP